MVPRDPDMSDTGASIPKVDSSGLMRRASAAAQLRLEVDADLAALDPRSLSLVRLGARERGDRPGSAEDTARIQHPEPSSLLRLTNLVLFRCATLCSRPRHDRRPNHPLPGCLTR